MLLWQTAPRSNGLRRLLRACQLPIDPGHQQLVVASVVVPNGRRHRKLERCRVKRPARGGAPHTGCSKVSPGCAHCYAETFAARWRGIPGNPYEQGFDLKLWPSRLNQPLRWTRPRMIFVNSMSDLFHEDIPVEFIARVFEVMARADRHTFQAPRSPCRDRQRLALAGERMDGCVDRESSVRRSRRCTPSSAGRCPLHIC